MNITGFPFPLGPFLRRRTIRREVDAGRIWVFEQQQALGFSSVATNIRMTVIRLAASSELWVHAPVAPTAECLALLAELRAPVRYIVLPTFAYEHKIFVGPFSRAFPRAQVWVAPRQWSWPLDLPLQFLGIFGARTLRGGGPDQPQPPWAPEIQHKVLSSPVGIGPYTEVAFYHAPTRTLLLTDAVVLVPDTPPEVVPVASLLAAARNGLAVRVLSRGRRVPDEPVVDSPAARQRGWERMVLQILFLGPADLLEPAASFAQISNRLIVSPIVRTLVFSKVPETVREWVDAIVRDWKFKRIIPAHFAAPISATGSDLLAAFAFLDELIPEDNNKAAVAVKKVMPSVWSPAAVSANLANLFGRVSTRFSEEDMRTLTSLDSFLVSVGAVKKTVQGRKKSG